MRKVDHILFPDTIQDFSGGFVERALAAIMMRLEPHPLEESPHRLRDVEVRRICGKIENVKSSFLPLVPSPGNFTFAMDGCVVQNNKSHFVNRLGIIVQPLRKFLSGYGVSSVKSFVFTVGRHHSEYIEPFLVIGRHMDILIVELPSIWNIATGADMALVSEKEIDCSCTPKIYKFLQLIAFELNKLRRGIYPWTFSYTFISCASKSKKRLKVASLTSRFDSFCHSDFAVLMLSLWFVTASLTDCVSAAVIKGLGPLIPFSLRPSMPSFSYRRTQLYTAIFPYPTMAAISSPFIPSALRRTPWHRIRYLWHEPNFRPLSNSSRCEVVKFIFFVFPIVCASYRSNRTITLGNEQIVYH